MSCGFCARSFNGIIPRASFPQLTRETDSFISAVAFSELISKLPAGRHSRGHVGGTIYSLTRLVCRVRLTRGGTAGTTIDNTSATVKSNNDAANVMASMSSNDRSVSCTAPRRVKTDTGR